MLSQGCLEEQVLLRGTRKMCVFGRVPGGAGIAEGTRKIDVCVFLQEASLSPHFRHLEWLPPSRCRRLHWRAEPSLNTRASLGGSGVCPGIF